MALKAVNKGCSLQYLPWVSMLNRLLMLGMNLPFVDSIHLCSKRFVTGDKIKATGEVDTDVIVSYLV